MEVGRLDPQRGVRSPPGSRGGVRSRCSARTRRADRRAMAVRLGNDPPAIVLVDGFTELAWLRYPGSLDGLIADRCPRELSAPGSHFPTPVEVSRLSGLPVPAAP